MFQLLLIERDDTVGNPDATVTRRYPLETVDTASHALRLQDEHEARLRDDWRMTRRTSHGNPGTVTEHYVLLIDRKHPHEYGNVYRSTRIVV